MSFSFKKGFTIFEMLVVISIFVIMTGIAIANLPSFRDRTFVGLIAQEIAVTIRQAQTFGIGTRVAGSGEFPSHGIYYDGGNGKSLVLFADLDGGGDYDESSGERIELFTIQGAAEIIQPINDFTILFDRPYPDAKIKLTGSCGGTLCENLQILVQSTRDTSNEKIVEIWNTGHIVVKDVPPAS